MRSSSRCSALLCLLASACAASFAAPLPVPERVDLVLPDLSGHPFDIKDLRGQVVLLDIFASWCEPCRESLPFYAELERRHRVDGVAVVAVSVDDNEPALRRFMAETGVSLRVLRDPAGGVADALGVRAMPTLFIVDRDGMLRHRHESFRSSDRPRIERRVAEVLR